MVKGVAVARTRVRSTFVSGAVGLVDMLGGMWGGCGGWRNLAVFFSDMQRNSENREASFSERCRVNTFFDTRYWSFEPFVASSSDFEVSSD